MSSLINFTQHVFKVFKIIMSIVRPVDFSKKSNNKV